MFFGSDVLSQLMREELYDSDNECLELLDQLPFPRNRTVSSYFSDEDRKGSVFWKRYVQPALDDPDAEIRDDDSREGALFHRRFRVPYRVFEWVVEDLKRVHGLGDFKVDAKGRQGVHIRLLVLGSIRVLASGCTFDLVEELTCVSQETHRQFFHEKFCTWGEMVKGDHIKVPHDLESLRHVQSRYEDRGLPGCTGSVDCVHLVWDNCPASVRSECAGKNKVPTLAFEVAGSNTKRILHVSQFFWGTWNDKTISRLDSGLFQKLRGDGQFLKREVTFVTYDLDGTRKWHRGAYMICDGGYNDWHCLICPFKHQLPGTDMEIWSQLVESVRKDIECIFGILKKRFLFLKHPIRIQDPKMIERAFVTACVLHNVLLDYDGYDDLEEDEVPEPYNILDEMGEMVARETRNLAGVAGVQSAHRQLYGVQDGGVGEFRYTNDENESREMNQRRQALIDHYTHLRGESDHV